MFYFRFLSFFLFFLWALRCGQCWLLLCVLYVLFQFSINYPSCRFMRQFLHNFMTNLKILIWYSISSPNISASGCQNIRTLRGPGAHTIMASFQVFRASLSRWILILVVLTLSAELPLSLVLQLRYFWLSPHRRILRGHRKSSMYGLNGYTYCIYHLICICM